MGPFAFVVLALMLATATALTIWIVSIARTAIDRFERALERLVDIEASQAVIKDECPLMDPGCPVSGCPIRTGMAECGKCPVAGCGK